MIEQRNFNFSVLLQKARSNEIKIYNTGVTCSVLPEKILIPERQISYEDLIEFGIENEDLIVNRMNKPRLRERSIWTSSSCVSVIKSKVINEKDDRLNFKTIKTCNEKSNQMNLDSTNNTVENKSQEINVTLSDLKSENNFIKDNQQDITITSSVFKNANFNVKDVQQEIKSNIYPCDVKISNKSTKRSRLRYCDQRKKLKIELQKDLVNLNDLILYQMEINFQQDYKNLVKECNKDILQQPQNSLDIQLNNNIKKEVQQETSSLCGFFSMCRTFYRMFF